MINPESMEKANKLMQQYEYNWGIKVDLTFMPPSMTQEDFVIVLERIVETGESVVVGWRKCFLEG